MPGWMGMRGLQPKSVHDMGRERRDTSVIPNQHSEELQRRADEKVQSILRDQQGDMSAFTGGGELSQGGGDDICARPVERIMSSKVAVLSFDDTILIVQGIFAAVKFRHLPVVDDAGGIIGIVSDRDILRMTSPFFGTVNEQTRDKEIMTRKVGVSMTRGPVCAHPDTTILGAIKIMNARKISCLPVITDSETKKLIGIVTWKDIVRAFCPAGFNRTSDSQRMKTGVKLKPETTDDTRVIVRGEEDARIPAPAPVSAPAQTPRQKLSYEEEVSLASKRLAARVRAARESAADTANAANASGHAEEEEPFFPPHPPAPPPPPERLPGEGDTKIIPHTKP